MHPSSRTWHRQDGLADKRKRPSAHDFFDEPKKRARPEEAGAVSRDCSPEKPRESEFLIRGKAGDVSPTRHPQRRNCQNSRQYSPLFVSPTNECQHDNQTQPFTARDYPLSPLSRSPEHMSDGSRERKKRASRQTVHGSFSTGEISRSSRVSTTEIEREYPMAPSTVIAAKSDRPVTRKTPSQAASQPTQQIAIVESLADFAKFITSASTLEVKHDLLKQQTAAEEQKRHRLQKFKSSFDFFDDDEEYRVEAVTKSAARLEQQIQLHQHKQLEIASNLAANLQRDQATPLGSDKAENVNGGNAIKEGLAKLDKKLENAKAEIADLKQKSLVQIDLNKHLDTLVTRDDLAKSTEQRAAQIIDDFQKDWQANRDINNQHTQRLDGLNARLEDKERNINGLAEKIRDQETTVRLLEALVRGDGNNNDPGLKTLIMHVSTRLSAMQARVQKTESDMQQLGDKVSRMQTPQSSDDNSLWRKDLDSLRQEMNFLHHSHVEQQKAEFDFLASDLERLDDHAKKQAKEIEDLERSQAEKIENLKQSSGTTSRPQPPPTPPLTSMPFVADEQSQRKFKDIETSLHRLAESQKGLGQFKERFETILSHLSNRTTAMETMSVAQQQKFDGLTTDHLFTCIINHLRNMYPNLPVNVAARMSEVIGKQNAFEQFLGVIHQRLSETELRLNQAEQRHAALQTHSLETANVLNGLKPELSRLKDVAPDNKIHDRVDQLGETTKSIEIRLEILKTESSAEIEKYATNVAAIRSDIAVLKEQRQVAMATTEDLRRRTSTALDDSSSDSDAPLGKKRKWARK